MMKTYEKPKLIALSLSGNDHLCGSCDGGLKLGSMKETDALYMYFSAILDTNQDKKISRDEFMSSSAFGNDESCTIPVTGYCKFNSAQNGTPLVAWS